MQGIEKLKRLRKLYLDRNKIRQIEALENLEALEYLDLSAN